MKLRGYPNPAAGCAARRQQRFDAKFPALSGIADARSNQRRGARAITPSRGRGKGEVKRNSASGVRPRINWGRL